MAKPETETKSFCTFESPYIKPFHSMASTHKQERYKRDENPHSLFKTSTFSNVFLGNSHMQTMTRWRIPEIRV